MYKHRLPPSFGYSPLGYAYVADACQPQQLCAKGVVVWSLLVIRCCD